MPKRKTSDKQFIEIQNEIDIEKFRESVKTGFSDVADPRNSKRCVYPLWYLFLLILSGYLAGCNTIADIAHFGQLRANWLADLSGLNVPAPSYDTIWWFFVRVKPKLFKSLLAKWLQGVPQELKGQILAIDGKRVKGISDNEHITHLVELFVSERRLVIAQERVPNKTGEIDALPKLLENIDVTGSVISMDAAYAYIDVVQKILEKNADYIVGIKANQKLLKKKVQEFFENVRAKGCDNIKGLSRSETFENAHGRKERRHILVTHDLSWLPQREKWKFNSIIEIRSERTIGTKVEKSVRYYGSSRKATPEEFLKWIRAHWGIENGLHYVMDVIFEEDRSLSDTGYSAENMALIRRLAMNVVKTYDPGRGMTDARRAAIYAPRYLRGLLGKLFVK